MRKILIVEDETDLRDFLKLRLEAKNYKVFGACDGREAFEKAARYKPDLILLDLMLPKIDGYWVCNFLKHDARHAKIPIIVVTAKSGAASKRLAYDCGADDYVEKPFEMEELLVKIAAFLRK